MAPLYDPTPAAAPDRRSWQDGGVQITILGHASVLIETAEARLLIDPLFSDRFAHDAIGFHPARTIHRDRLPDPTAIGVTHLHLDHWHPARCRPSTGRRRSSRPPTPGCSAASPRSGSPT
jgi:glyoxylase-like metal-dependent hydrolase (beta-lactamase superfamily II)